VSACALTGLVAGTAAEIQPAPRMAAILCVSGSFQAPSHAARSRKPALLGLADRFMP